jgi:hypothetical protein
MQVRRHGLPMIRRWMKVIGLLAVPIACAILLWIPLASPRGPNLIANPSFEIAQPRDLFGRVFAGWEGWRRGGDCSVEAAPEAHRGATSALLACRTSGEIHITQERDLEPGRYLVTAFLRGRDIGDAGSSETIEFMFGDTLLRLARKGSFGWTPLTYVAEVGRRSRTGPSFGLAGRGFLWIDDVSMERVGGDVPLTPSPRFGVPEKSAPAAPAAGHARFRSESAPPPVQFITSFEHGNPFTGGVVVGIHATDGAKALRVDRPYAAMNAPQDWSGYDYLKIDTYVDSPDPLLVTVEIQDRGTHDYWTRVNYETAAPPGRGSLALPLKQLYVGEKSRPGRPPMLNGITRLVIAPGPGGAALYIDRLRLERDVTARQAWFEGLYAFDFGPVGSPVMDGFAAVTPAALYTPSRGYGLKNARIWRAFDELQPDPLYEDYICLESGGLAVDVPNGKYRVVVNMDSPGGFWGEYQVYRERSILAQGKRVVFERQDFESFKKRYFQFWDTEDLPADNTFDKYDRAHFAEKMFDVQVDNGQLNLEFEGRTRACSVSAVIFFPIEKATQGARFLEWVREKRRSYFDDAFQRVLHRPAGGALPADDNGRGYVLFQRDLMQDVYYNDAPSPSEMGRQALSVEAFAGQVVPASFAVLPLRDLGAGSIAVSALEGPGAAIPPGAIDLGYVSYRITRVTPSGSVYTITPRYVVPRNRVALPRGVARRFWLTVHIPAAVRPGLYAGRVTFTPARGAASSIPVRLTVLRGALDPIDIAAGPWGGQVDVPWFADDPQTAKLGSELTAKSLRLLRAHGFTMFTGAPHVLYRGWGNGQPELDFSQADREMETAGNLGFLAVNSYGAGVIGVNAYYQDAAKMKAAGFTDYSAFVKAIYRAVQHHAAEKHWPAVYWNLGDEPSGDDLRRSIENAAAYRKAFPEAPPFFTAATSLSSRGAGDPRFALARALDVPNLNGHDEASVNLLKGQPWAFYNTGGDRWTYGVYLYKAAKEYNLKFRLGWHWDGAAGDPYYALDTREDDYAWANAGPQGQLLPSVQFFRIGAGLDDYRCLLTLARLAKTKEGSPAARAAESLIRARMAAFHLGQLDHDRIFGAGDWESFRRRMVNAIEALQ